MVARLHYGLFFVQQAKHGIDHLVLKKCSKTIVGLGLEKYPMRKDEHIGSFGTSLK